jgi:hypothetical protein
VVEWWVSAVGVMAGLRSSGVTAYRPLLVGRTCCRRLSTPVMGLEDLVRFQAVDEA